ncbi:HD domain-containing protein (plasmid) [Nocardia sp. CA-084685]|uniref:HD domain-containing protein n=1 Tax=Nocardia sp. CA-084685 TaxID=3239970 RepID=UPI003D979226
MLPLHDHPIVATALRLARTWYDGHSSATGTTALAHAVAVANTISAHAPGSGPELIAAALLHRARELAPPVGTGDLATMLTDCCSAEVAQLVTATEPKGADALLVSSANTTVTLTAALDAAAASGDEATYWSTHPHLSALVGSARALHTTGTGQLPDTLAELLDAMITRAEAIGTHNRSTTTESEETPCRQY